jgi:MerR family transcriptional regulator, copper efflux regulator
MLISEFARVTGLTRDTVRFYARLGLLQPQTNGKGGRHPYSVFTRKDIQAAEVVRIAQSLGMSLKEIAAVNEERRDGELTCERSLEITSAQLQRLEAKATELETMISYVRAKIEWLTRGKKGPQPDFGSYKRGSSRVTVDETGKPPSEDGRSGSCTVSSNSVR